MVAVDVTGARLIEAAAAGADLVSPNLVEAEQALDADGTSRSPDGTGEAVDLDDLDGTVVAARSRAAAASLVEVGARARHGLGRPARRRLPIGGPRRVRAGADR